MIGGRRQFGLETYFLSSNKLHEAETFFNSRPCVSWSINSTPVAKLKVSLSWPQ